MSEVRHIEIIEAVTDSDGNFLQAIDEGDYEEVDEIMFAEENDTDDDNKDFEHSGTF